MSKKKYISIWMDPEVKCLGKYGYVTNQVWLEKEQKRFKALSVESEIISKTIVNKSVMIINFEKTHIEKEVLMKCLIELEKEKCLN